MRKLTLPIIFSSPDLLWMSVFRRGNCRLFCKSMTYSGSSSQSSSNFGLIRDELYRDEYLLLRQASPSSRAWWATLTSLSNVQVQGRCWEKQNTKALQAHTTSAQVLCRRFGNQLIASVGLRKGHSFGRRPGARPLSDAPCKVGGEKNETRPALVDS